MRITTKEAAKILGCSEEAVRLMIQFGKIPGACAYYHGKGQRMTYYITAYQCEAVKKGCLVDEMV